MQCLMSEEDWTGWSAMKPAELWKLPSGCCCCRLGLGADLLASSGSKSSSSSQVATAVAPSEFGVMI